MGIMFLVRVAPKYQVLQYATVARKLLGTANSISH